MNDTAVLNVLVTARATIKDPANWVQGTLHDYHQGRTRHCSIGALDMTGASEVSDVYRAAVAELFAAIRPDYRSSYLSIARTMTKQGLRTGFDLMRVHAQAVADFNDNTGHTWVMEMFDKAITTVAERLGVEVPEADEIVEYHIPPAINIDKGFTVTVGPLTFGPVGVSGDDFIQTVAEEAATERVLELVGV